uniref:Uncharacterized protein n=1 Tax=viral metagenome TaxID=1070528 RepID=A0A6C0CD26_9ZZZZ
MGDIRTTTYQAQELQKLVDSDEQVTDIYRDLPDQFWKYENMTYNPLDFFTSSGEFNLALFNKTYRDEQLKRMNYYNEIEKKRLEELNALQISNPDLLELSLGDHLINLKNTPFEIAKDLRTQPLNSEILLKGNRIFYLGIYLIGIFVLYLIINNLVDTAKELD